MKPGRCPPHIAPYLRVETESLNSLRAKASWWLKSKEGSPDRVPESPGRAESLMPSERRGVEVDGEKGR